VNNPRHHLRALTLALLAASPLAAQALDPAVETGLEVIGLVDLDSFGPQPPLLSQQQSVSTLPLPVSQIKISEGEGGVYIVRSSADIGLLELKVYGSITNGSARIRIMFSSLMPAKKAPVVTSSVSTRCRTASAGPMARRT